VSYVNRPAPAVNGALVIQHIVTADDPFGEPWPPDGFCSVVHRARGFTLWRRVISSSPTTPGAASAGEQTRAPQGDDKMTYDLKDYSGEYFIKPDDVRKKALRRRITDVRKGNYDKLELVFDRGEVLSLNATNTRALSRVYGGSSDALIGKIIEMYLGQIPYNGANNDAVLVNPITPPEKPPFDDEIKI
jgi:hypothetical protein